MNTWLFTACVEEIADYRGYGQRVDELDQPIEIWSI